LAELRRLKQPDRSDARVEDRRNRAEDLKSIKHGCSVGRDKTGREPLVQEAAAGGSQIHFTPEFAFGCPITMPSRMPMVITVAT
jgi:hypothetical protein